MKKLLSLLLLLSLATNSSAVDFYGNRMLNRCNGSVYSTTPSSGVFRVNQPSGAIFNLSAVKPAFTAMSSERVAIIGIGDSNQNLGGHGWDWGIPYGLFTAGYQMFGTGLLSGTVRGGSLGFGFSSAFGYGGNSTGAPAPFSDYLNKGSGDGMAFFGYSYMTDGESFSNNNNGMQVSISPDTIGVHQALRGHAWYGTFASGTGQFRMAFRVEGGGYPTVAQGSTINPVTGSDGIAETTLDVTAATRVAALGWKSYTSGTGVTLEGPSFFTWVWVENPARTNGFAYSTIDGQGGQSTREIAYNLQQLSDTTLDHYLTVIRSQLGSNKKIIWWINEGLNDRNESVASVGPGAVTPGNSAAAYADNTQAIINRVSARYTANGWNFSEVYWMVMTSHPQSNPDDAQLITYRDICKTTLTVNNARLACIDLSKITTYQELLNGSGGGGAASYYATNGTDPNHMTQPGYEFLGLKTINTIGRP